MGYPEWKGWGTRNAKDGPPGNAKDGHPDFGGGICGGIGGPEFQRYQPITGGVRLRSEMGLDKTFWVGVALGAALCGSAAGAQPQDAKVILQQAVNAELAANRDDHSHWRYVETVDGNKFVVVETEYGALKRHLEEHGRPASAATLAADDERIQRFIHDPGMQAKQRRDGEHDDKSATELLNQMPEAFLWSVESETPDTIVLHFEPNPNFSPPDMQSRVMGKMAGTMIVDKTQHRIRTMKGSLSEDISIGFGLLGRLHRGGTFDVERKQIAPGLWQIAETHVHIEGRALFFKTIGQQEDEVKWDFTPVPPGTTLEQAVALLKEPLKETARAGSTRYPRK
jgi:hypothetical protein